MVFQCPIKGTTPNALFRATLVLQNIVGRVRLAGTKKSAIANRYLSK